MSKSSKKKHKNKDGRRNVFFDADQIADESLDVTREMMRLCLQSQDAGAATLAMLHRQGNQLEGIESGMDDIHQNLISAEDNLIQMERTERSCCFRWCCCCCKNCCLRSSRTKEKDPEIWKRRASLASPPIVYQPKSFQNNNGNGDYIQRVTNDEKEDEMESNLQGVSNFLQVMKQQAMGIGSETKKQNEGLDRTNLKAESNTVRLEGANKKAINLLN